MATRQYIGARYVPKFADPIEWSNTTSYEALTIVTYAGGSYTSKKAVPAGITPTNTEYWAFTGNYNAQVEEYRQETQQLAADVADLVYAVRAKNVILIGDSYGIARGDVTVTYPERVKQFLGMNDNNFRYAYQNGAGFANGRFYNNFSGLLQQMSNVEKEAVTDVYFIGGWNDENGNTSVISGGVTSELFLAGVANCENLIASELANAKKHVIFLAAGVKAGDHSDLNTTMGWYDSLNYRGWYVEPNVRYCLMNPAWFYEDGLHPNQAGNNHIADAVSMAILNGQANCDYQFTIAANTFSPASGITSSYASTIIQVHNSISTINIFSLNNLVFSFNNAYTVTLNGNRIQLGGMSKQINGQASNVVMPCEVGVYNSEGFAGNIHGFMMIRENVVYFVPERRYTDETLAEYATIDALKLVFPMLKAEVATLELC